MARRRTLGSRMLSGGALGALAAIFGCTQIFGFQSPGTLCHLNSDCPDNEFCSQGACTLQCNASRDCAADEVCGGGLCRRESDAAVVEETGADVGPVLDAAPSCGDLMTDPDNCGMCGTQCSKGPCELGMCRVIVPFGASAQTAAANVSTKDVGPLAGDSGLGEIAGVQIDITEPGWVVQLGMLTAEGGAQGYLGLYTDDGGQPADLVAWTGEFTVSGGASSLAPQATVEPVVEVTPVPAGHYWVLGMWQSQLAFETVSGSLSCDNGCEPWYFAEQTFGPLPQQVSRKQSLPLAPIPILYAGVAE
jgi:hypothetical protein